MIALLNLTPEPVQAAAVELLDSLPGPPALRWSGFLIRCGEHLTINEVIQWCSAVRRSRPALPIGIVAEPEPVVLRTIAASGVVLDPVLIADDLPGGRVASDAINIIRIATVEAKVVERWIQQYGIIDTEEFPTLYALAIHAVRGGRIKSIKNSFGYSIRTLTRRLRKIGYPPPGTLLREGRIASVQIRIDMGVEPRLAREAAGWDSAELVRRARRRFRDEAKGGGGGGPCGGRPGGVQVGMRRNSAVGHGSDSEMMRNGGGSDAIWGYRRLT